MKIFDFIKGKTKTCPICGLQLHTEKLDTYTYTANKDGLTHKSCANAVKSLAEALKK